MLVRESPAAKGPHPAVLALMSGFLVFAAWGLLAWAGARDEAGEIVGRPTSFDRQEEAEERRLAALITDLDQILDSPHPAALRGRQVVLFEAPVQSIVGDWFFWVGRDEERRIPVMLLGERARRQREWSSAVLPGQSVRIFGFVRLAGDAEPLRADPLLDDVQRRAVRNARIFISALRVEILR